MQTSAPAEPLDCANLVAQKLDALAGFAAVERDEAIRTDAAQADRAAGGIAVWRNPANRQTVVDRCDVEIAKRAVVAPYVRVERLAIEWNDRRFGFRRAEESLERPPGDFAMEHLARFGVSEYGD